MGDLVAKSGRRYYHPKFIHDDMVVWIEIAAGLDDPDSCSRIVPCVVTDAAGDLARIANGKDIDRWIRTDHVYVTEEKFIEQEAEVRAAIQAAMSNE